MTRADSSLVGTLLQRRYRVDALLARGGMAAVHRGFDTRLERPVAIKITAPQYADDQSFVERFQHEARAAATLHHPNVVAVHDQGVDNTMAAGEDQRAFLVMELVTGGTLRNLLDSHGALDVHTTLSVIEPILAALAAAHGSGLAHRDIKPENILISADQPAGGTSGGDRVKVTDFGLARAAAGAHTTESGAILGTVAYLAPEQVTSGAAGAPGDVYSTGILLYEMLTGAVPYDGDTALSVAYRHVNDEVPAPSSASPGLPPALDELVLRATHRDPEQRPADAAQLLREIRQLRNTLGIELVPVPLPEPAADFPTQQLDKYGEHTVPAMRAVTTPVGNSVRVPRHGTRTLHQEPESKAVPEGTEPAGMEPEATEPESTEPEATEPRRRRGKRLVALCAVVGLLLTAGGLVWWLNARWITVPGVTGLSTEQARDTLDDTGLAAKFTREPHDTVEESTVIGTDPAGGTDALPGDHITVRVSEGKPTVPDIPQGTDPKDAAQQVEDAHLTPRRDSAANRYSTRVRKGTVLSVHPTVGSEANVDDPVTLILSKGSPPEPIPEVAGQTKEEAFDALRDKGFKPFAAGGEFSEKIAEDRVVRTDPAAESHSGIDGSMRVGVYLSTAVEVPSVRGRSLDDAAEMLRDVGLEVDLTSTLGGDEDDHTRIALVVEQDPEAGERVESGSTIELRTVP